MSIGIYRLVFAETDKTYIGQSVDIEKRFKQHIYALVHNKSVPKLQNAFLLYGLPSLEILTECSIEELDEFEIEAIDIFDSVLNGFNTLSGGSKLVGINNPSSKYAEEDYYNVLVLLGTRGISWKEISKFTGVSEYVISHISAKESHTWLKEAFPEEYTALELIHSTTGRQTAFMQGIRYPKIISPDGVIYEVECPTHFAKAHGLLQPKLHEVLTRSRNSHRGWMLVGSTSKPAYPTIVSPDGTHHTISFGEAKKFSEEFGLTHANLHRLLTGKQKSHKGWKLLQGI